MLRSFNFVVMPIHVGSSCCIEILSSVYARFLLLADVHERFVAIQPPFW